MYLHNYYVYILTNPKHTVLYIGVTNDLSRRLEEHILNAGNPATFAGKFYCHTLLYYERFTFVDHAIQREKELKKWNRSKKESLINSLNPHWLSLNSHIQED